MSDSERGSHHHADRLTAESYYALLAALTVIKAQGQMVRRWVHRSDVPDSDVVLGRLEAIDRMVGQCIVALDAMPAAEAEADDPDVSPDGGP